MPDAARDSIPVDHLNWTAAGPARRWCCLSSSSAELLRPVEQYPHREVFRDILEPVRYLRGTEQQIAGADIVYPVLDPVATGAAGDDVQFVAWVRNLRPIGWPGREADLQIAIDKHLSRAARGSWQRQGSGEQYGRRRAIYPTLADVDPPAAFLASLARSV